MATEHANPKASGVEVILTERNRIRWQDFLGYSHIALESREVRITGIQVEVQVPNDPKYGHHAGDARIVVVSTVAPAFEELVAALRKMQKRYEIGAVRYRHENPCFWCQTEYRFRVETVVVRQVPAVLDLGEIFFPRAEAEINAGKQIRVSWLSCVSCGCGIRVEEDVG